MQFRKIIRDGAHRLQLSMAVLAVEGIQGVDLPSELADKLCTKSTESFKYSCALLRKLISLLPSGNVVFVVLDSVSRISGDNSLVDDLAKMILGVGKRKHSIVIKHLVTDPVPSNIWKIANYSLHVPGDVDGWECGMNTGSIRGRKLRSFDALKAYRKTHDREIYDKRSGN